MKNKHILIVEDSPTDIEAMKSVLQQIGEFQISVAENGQEGIEKAKSELPDLILMDVVMPILNGFQATRHLSKAEETAHIPIIIVTTKEQVSDNIWAIRQGASGFINKPASKSELETLVNEAIA